MVDIFIITTALGGVTSIALGFKVRILQRAALKMKFHEYSQDEKIVALTRTNEQLQWKVDCVHAQRVAASRRATEVKKKNAAERKQERVDTTREAIAILNLPPRSEVVSGVRDERPRRNSTQGVAAKQAG